MRVTVIFINNLLVKIRDKGGIIGNLLADYEEPKVRFKELPVPLLIKTFLLYGASSAMLILGIALAATGDSWKPLFAGIVLCLVFLFITLRHQYIFTRRKYCRVYAYVARIEYSKPKLRKDLVTYILLPDKSERQLLLGKKRLNIGQEYAFYFGLTAGSTEPNISVLYGIETAAEADAHIEKVNALREERRKQEQQGQQEQQELPAQDEENDDQYCFSLPDEYTSPFAGTEFDESVPQREDSPDENDTNRPASDKIIHLSDFRE